MQTKLTKISENERLVVRNNTGLSRYLESLDEAKAATQRSWLYEDKDPQWVLQSWMDQLDSLRHGTEFEQNVFQFDTSQVAKWGPQGGHPPIMEVMDVVEQGFGDSPSPTAFSTSDWRDACDAATIDLSIGTSLRPASYQHVVDDMRARDVLESNSGWPDFTRRNLPEVKMSAIRDAENGSWKDYPAITLFRNYNQKLRLVWMFPMATNLVESSFTQPLQRHLQSRSTYFSPWIGFEKVREIVSQRFDSGYYLAASDFSSTDAHFKLPTSMQAYSVVRGCFQRPYWELALETIQNLHSIPLLVGTDSMLVGQHGVASGSAWTNLIETIFDYQFSVYVERNHTSYSGSCGIGDDMLWESPKYSEKFAEELATLAASCGQDVNVEKVTNESDRVKFLQRLFQRGYRRPDGILRGVYSTIRALKSSVYPERFHDPRKWDSDMFCARQYMILENCVDHPLFEDFVKFVVRGQRDLVPFAHKNGAKLDAITRRSRLLPGLNPTYNQEKRDQALSKFASIQIARSL